jgi:hypothetical protein
MRRQRRSRRQVLGRFIHRERCRSRIGEAGEKHGPRLGVLGGCEAGAVPGHRTKMARKNKNGSRLLVPPRSEKMRDARRPRSARPTRHRDRTGHSCADDYGVIFRGMAIGRIRKTTGAAHTMRRNGSRSCHLHRPAAGAQRPGQRR